VYNNTFYAIDDAVYENIFNEDIRRFPYHLGVAWHLAKDPPEIYAIAKQLVDLCDCLPPEGDRPQASWRHLEREVSKCVEEIVVQTRLNKFVMEIQLAQVIAHGNYITRYRWYRHFGPNRSLCLTVTQDSVIPAIIIKRHRLLEYWYDTSRIYNTNPVISNSSKLGVVPSIDQFREQIATAIYARVGRQLRIPIEGTCEDREGLFQDELPFIPSYIPPTTLPSPNDASPSK